MPDADGLSPGADELLDPQRGAASAVAALEEELAGPDRSVEHFSLYGILFALLVLGSALLRNNLIWDTGATAHSIMEAVATLLAFIIGGLALVRFYSRKQITFLFIGTGFLGAGLLDLNHALITSEVLIAARLELDPTVKPGDLFAWSWTAARVFLSLFLFVSLLAWRQEVREGGGEGLPEGSVYGTALALTLLNLLFFEWVPLAQATFPTQLISRPAELLPALFFALAFVGFLRKGSWRRDPFEHWLLVSLLISVLAHAGFMAFSEQRYDAMFDAAHLLKVASYVAILSGLLSSVYGTFRREAEMLDALTGSNAQLAHEIEVRAQTERAAKESRARLQGFLDNANDLIQSVTPEGSILYVNSAWKRVLGYDDEELAELNLLDIVHPAHRRRFENEVARVLGGGRPGRYNVEYLASDGRVVILSGSMQALFEGDRPVATQSILRDVTEQRLAERQLDESRANLAALVENTGDSIWSIDRDHRLITLNSAFALAMEARTGSEPKVGQQPSEVFAPEDVEWYEELYDRTLSGERHVALRTDHVEGHLRYFELYANPIHSLEGVTGGVIFGKDVTPRVRAEEALRVAKDEAEAANKAKSDFLANMSHELRTPLNSVIGFTNILLKNKDERLNEKDLGFLQRVLSNGKHLLALINEVLDLAKVEAGRMELIIEDVNLADVCVETVQQLEGQAKAKDGAVELVADVPDSVALVETDSAKLKQVIINLVGNALKFTEKGSVTVRLDLATDGRTPVAISVVDTGIGIPDDRLEAIFEAFQQAEAGTSRKYGGTGLGLALSRSICLLMGYDLIVESEVGKGSTFKIVMGERAERPVREAEPEEPGLSHAEDFEAAMPPADETAPEAAPAQPKAPRRAPGEVVPGRPRRAATSSLSNFKVLVVDDEKDSRVLISHYLEEFGCQVVTATDGEQALEAAREHRPDLMTLDLMMPGISGWEVLERIKADPDLRSIPVVIVSVVAGDGRGRLLGAADIVPKPFEREDLLRVLWRNLGRRGEDRVLLVSDQPEAGVYVDFLRGLGLGVAAAEDLAAGLKAVRSEVPDAVVVYMGGPAGGNMGFLRRLRENRAHAGLPVFVVVPPDTADADRDALSEYATVVLTEERAIAELRDLLGSVFPLLESSGATE